MQETSDPFEQATLQNYIKQYLSEAPEGDPAIPMVEQLKKDLDIQDLERKLRQRARYRLNNASSLSMVEQTLLDAIHIMPEDPQMALDRLAAIKTLYADPGIERSKRDEHLLQVEGLLTERAKQTLLTYEKIYLQPISLQLDRAEQFLDANPIRTKQVAQSIITLYADHAWAAGQIARADALIEAAKLKINVTDKN